MARTTLADANERRDWRIYADFAQVLIGNGAARYMPKTPSASELDQGLYPWRLRPPCGDCVAFTRFPWARFRRHKAAVKMHTLLDLHGNIPAFIHVTDGKVHDVNGSRWRSHPKWVPSKAWTAPISILNGSFGFSLCSAFFVRAC